MRCDPRLLRPFVALAEELHFGRAAAKLDITQPALSQQIARLERQLGVRLFDRTRAHVELTEAGEAVLASARAATEAQAAFDATARAHAQGEAGELRLGLSPGAHYLAQPLLAEFARTHPGVRVKARTDSSGALAEQVAAGRLELALGFCTAPTPRTAITHLTDEPVVVAVARDHPLATTPTVALTDLATETFALVDAHDGAGYNDAVEQHCRDAGFEPRTIPDPQGPMAWETAVRTRGCVGLTARSSAPATAKDVVLLELDPPATFPLELIEPAGPPVSQSPAARAFARLAASFGA